MKHNYHDVKSVPHKDLPKEVNKIMWEALSVLDCKELTKFAKANEENKLYAEIDVFDEFLRPIFQLEMQSGIMNQMKKKTWIQGTMGGRPVFVCNTENKRNLNVIFSSKKNLSQGDKNHGT
jgi:hypothetical protein